MGINVKSPLISLIIRTKNEERWISSCLNKIKQQTIDDIEVILVDNNSTDKTVERAKSVIPELGLVTIEDYLPGKSLNKGIRAANGEYIVCVSSHCVPKNEDWLETMLENFTDSSNLAGVYGRQIPMHFTNKIDKRDLIVTFGLDKRIQKKDPFFHNANSMIPKKVWDQFPFDEETTNIEDRLWAKEVLDAGYHIIYEPEAPVYHHHGIYQNQDQQRLNNVIQIIENNSSVPYQNEDNPFNQSRLNIPAIIPVREEPGLDIRIQKELLKITIESAKESSAIDQVIINTNSQKIADYVQKFEVEVPFIRPESLADESAVVVDVLQQTLEWYESQGTYFDYLAILLITHPFRPKGIVQKCIDNALETGLKSVIAGMPEYRPTWWYEDEEYHRIDDFLHTRREREPIHIGLPAICNISTPSLIRSGKLLDDKVGIVEIENQLAQIEVRNNQDFESVMKLHEFTDKVNSEKTYKYGN